MRKRLIFAIMVMGFSGLVAQILLLRELLIIFYGNELSIGIILANWLILEAFGCFFLGKRIGHFKRRIGAFVGLQLIFSLYLPLAIYLIRTLKDIIGVSAGEGLGLIPMLCSSFLILLPISVSHGALFTFGCKLYSLYSSDKGRSLPDAWQAGASGSKQQGAQSIGKVYIYETIGTILGGIGLTYLLIPYFHSFQIAFGVSLLNIILCAYLLGPFWQKKQIATNKVLGSLSGALLVVCAYLLFSPESDKIQQFSVNQQWKGQEVLHYQNSTYGNVVVTKREGQYTLFSDGIPIITSPVPDITFVEEFVHLPMLSHLQPKEILVISGGAGGLINEILKHPVERVDYAELDPLILEAVRRFPTALTEGELSDPRVNIKHIDGRLFVKTSLHKYDLVLVGLSNPSDLQVNRLFTKEFFSLVLKRLKEEGILVISLPGSLTYLSEELKNLNTCILNTLETIYPYVRAIPGDGTNLYLASTSPGVSLINHSQLSQRLKERKLNLSLLTPGHIEY
ncbi:MAG: spermine synthase, partial [Candidatus Omnitrophica bacterium]|nr:spermine synthase [Candidatus Omnitrophota bacterium]